MKASPSGTRTLWPTSSQDLVWEQQWRQAWADSGVRCHFLGNILARFGLVCQTLQALALVASIQGGQSSARSGIWMADAEEQRLAKELIEFRIGTLWQAVPDKETVVTGTSKLRVVPRALKFLNFEVQKFTEVPRPTSSLHSSPPHSYLLYSVSCLSLYPPSYC